MTSRTNHHSESPEQVGTTPLLLSALHLRRQGAIERYLAGDPIEAICREMGCSKAGCISGKSAMRASKPDWFQERSRRPRSTPTQTSEALERAIVHLRDSLSLGESRGVSAQVIREHLCRHHGEPLLASYDLSYPQAVSKEVTSYAGRCNVSRCSWRSRHSRNGGRV